MIGACSLGCAKHIRFLLHRRDDRLDRRGQAVDLYGLLDDLVPTDNQAVSREDLIVRAYLTSILNSLKVDFVDPGRLSAALGAHQADLLGVRRRRQSTAVLYRVK